MFLTDETFLHLMSRKDYGLSKPDNCQQSKPTRLVITCRTLIIPSLLYRVLIFLFFKKSVRFPLSLFVFLFKTSFCTLSLCSKGRGENIRTLQRLQWNEHMQWQSDDLYRNSSLNISFPTSPSYSYISWCQYWGCVGWLVGRNTAH